MTFEFAVPFVDSAPLEQGVYVLFDGNEIIYIDRAAGRFSTIREQLQRHFRGDKLPSSEDTSHFTCEAHRAPIEREAELLEAYRSKFGRLPRFNERVRDHPC